MEPFPYDLPLFKVKIEILGYLVSYGPFKRLRRSILIFQCPEATIIQLKDKFEFLCMHANLKIESTNFMTWNNRPIEITPQYKEYLSALYDHSEEELSYRVDGDVWEISPVQAYLEGKQFTKDDFPGKIRLTGCTPILPETFAYSSLRELNLGRTLIIPTSMLMNAERLENLTGPYVYNIIGSKIGMNAFRGCRSLSHISFPNVEIVGWGVFIEMSLDVVDMPRVRQLGERCFSNSRIGQIHCPRLEVIPNFCFDHTTHLLPVDLPMVKSVGSNAFAFSNVRDVSLPEAEKFGESTFLHCSELRNVNLPKLKEAGSYTFFDCSQLTEVSLPSLVKLEYQTFVKCTNLVTLRLVKVEEVTHSAAIDCPRLEKVTFRKLTLIYEDSFVRCPRYS